MTLMDALDIADEAMRRRTSDTNSDDNQQELIEAIAVLQKLREMMAETPTDEC